MITGNGLDIKSGLKSTYTNFFNQKSILINDLYFYEGIYDTIFEENEEKELQGFDKDLCTYCKPIYWLQKWLLYYLESNDEKDNNLVKKNMYKFFDHIDGVIRDYDYSYWILPDVMKKDISKNWNGLEGAILDYINQINNKGFYIDGLNNLKENIRYRCFRQDKDLTIAFNIFMIIAQHVFENKKSIKIFYDDSIEKIEAECEKIQKDDTKEKLKDVSKEESETKKIAEQRKKELKDELKEKVKDIFYELIENIDMNEFLNSELNKLENVFSDYLKHEVDRNEYKRNVIKNIYNLVGTESVNILNFNYTDYDTYIKDANNDYSVNVNKVFNIHGSVNDHIIFGIDNKSNEDYEEDNGEHKNAPISVPMFTKTYRIMSRTSKSKMFESNGSANNNDIYYLADQSYDVIKFFGHSLSDADYSYFQSIFDKLDLYNSDVVLEFYYSKHGTNNVYPDKDMHKVENNVFSLLSKYGGTLDNKSRGNNLMHKLLVEGRLVIKELE